MPPSARTRWSWSGQSTSTSRACARSWAMRPTSSRPSAASATDSMSHGWWSPDVGAERDRRPGRRLGRRAEAFGDQLGADHRDLARRLDPEPDLSPFEPDDRHADVVADKELFHQLA